MYTDMEWWKRIRLEVLRGETSKREVLRREGIHWETLKKILSYTEPPGYQRKGERVKPKIGLYLERIEEIIESDKLLPKKQRHTAKRIYERMKEMGYRVGIYPGEGGGSGDNANQTGSIYAAGSPSGGGPSGLWACVSEGVRDIAEGSIFCHGAALFGRFFRYVL